MSVCSSGMQQQRRKKLENKQKFVFDEKDVVPPLRAAVKKSSVQDRIARAREGKDLRTARFDPVLDEVTAKLEKEVAKIKLAELSASVKGSNVKSKTAEEKNSKMPVNLGPSSTVVDPKGMTKVPIVDAERAVKEKVGVKETNLAKEAALLKEANIERGRGGLVVGAAVKRATQTGKLIPTPDPVNMNVKVKKDPLPKAAESFKRLDAVEKVVVKEKITVSACPCSRALKLIMCADCGVTFTGRLQVECKAHPRALFLQDVSACTSCKQSDLFKLMEFDLPAGMEETLKKL